ncbi:MAG: formyltransferase family protein [Dehalococcoidia bacterium]
MNHAPLRAALLLDDPAVPWWLADGLARCFEAGSLSVVGACVRQDEAVAEGLWARRWRARATLAGRLLLRLDARRATAPEPADTPVRELAPGCELIEVAPITGRFTDEFPPDALDRLRALQVDVLLRVGFRILKGEILTAAPKGILSFHHGDNRVNRGGPTGVWEVLLGQETSGLTLQVMTAELDGGHVLARSVGRTVAFSFAGNRRAIFARSPAVFSRTVERIWRGDSGVHGSAAADPAWQGFDDAILRFPTNAQVIAGVVQMVRRRIKAARTFGGRTHQWAIAWCQQAGDTEGVPDPSLRRYRVWEPPAGRFRADPFPVVGEDGTHWLFFEELEYRVGKGYLRAVPWGAKGPAGEPIDILEEPHHLSYPNVFQLDREWFMLPEGAASGHVDMYHTDAFPGGWRRAHRLLENVPLIDPTLLEHDGHWYLFGNLTDAGIGPDDELHLYVADSPFGPFHPHPASPIVTDVRSARMAGRFFRAGGALHRPAQIGAPRYGAGVTIQQVEMLTPDLYRERQAQRLHPRWAPDLIGFHTLNAAGRLSTLDIRRLVPKGVGQP